MAQTHAEPVVPITPLEWALAYAAKGWAILPIWWVRDGKCACNDPECRSPGKHPIGYMVPNGLRSASKDETTIRAWGHQAPLMNVAIATGSASNLIVLDLDYRENGEEIIDGEFELKNWLATRNLELPETLFQSTGGGGTHILFDWPNAESNLRPVVTSRANWLPGVDIRADGGYIVATPSRHVTGKFYNWSAGRKLLPITPELLQVLSVEKRSSGSGSPLAPGPSLNIETLTREGFRLGGRDDGFTRLAGALLGRGDSLETARTIVTMVWEKTDQSDKDFFSLATALEKVERGYRTWEAPEPIDDDSMEWAIATDKRAQKLAKEQVIPTAAQRQRKSSVPEPIVTQPQAAKRATEAPSTVVDDDDDDGIDEDDTGPDIPDRDPSKPLGVYELMTGAKIERELPTMLRRSDGKYLIYPGKLHSIYGEPGHGKTWVLLHLVKEQLEAGKVVAYLDYDEDDGGKSMALRLLALGVDPNTVLANLRYLNPQGLGRDQELWKKLKRKLRKWQPSLVVVDTMAPALVELGLNEKDNAEVGAWYAHARWLLRGLISAPALVIVDHVVKSGEGRGRWARGAGDKLGRLHAAYSVDSAVPFSRTNEGYIELIIAKDRGGEIGREGDLAAIVKFTPSNNGERLTINVLSADSGGIGMSSEINEISRKNTIDRIKRVLRDHPRGLVLGDLKKAITVRNGMEATFIEELLDDNTLAKEGTGANAKYVWNSGSDNPNA